jgi:gamma-carbonic anhydrase
MSPPSLWQTFRQVIGRALRETGQSIHRVALKAEMLAVTKHEYYDDYVLFEDFMSRHRQLFPLLISGQPMIDTNTAFIAPCATLVGSVTVGARSSIWYGSVVRGDYGENVESFRKDHNNNNSNNKKMLLWELDEHRYRDRDDHHGGGVFIGNDTNIQDGCTITAKSQHTVIGNGVTIGQLAQLHSCTIGDYCLIGMGSVLQAGVVVENECLIGAGSVVPTGTVVHTGELWLGNPARKIRTLTELERQRLHYQSSEYVIVAQSHQKIMELGGNLDAAGSSVYIGSEEEEDNNNDRNALGMVKMPLLSVVERTTEPLFRALHQPVQLLGTSNSSSNTTTTVTSPQRKDRGYMPLTPLEMARKEQQKNRGRLMPRRLVRNIPVQQ